MKKLILLILILPTISQISILSTTKRPAINQLTPELIKKPKLNRSSKNTIKTTDNFLNGLKDEKIVEIIRKYIVVDSFFRCWEDPRFDCIEQLEIYQAIENKNYKKAAKLIDNNIDAEGYTPLTKAVIKNDIEAVKFFIKLGVNINSQDQSTIKTEKNNGTSIAIENTIGTTPDLIRAVKLNNLEMVKLLLQSGANLNAQDYLGGTALIWACIKNYSNIVRLLLNSNSKINLEAKTFMIPNESGLENNKVNTALHFAVLKNSGMCQELIKAGANLNALEGTGYKAIAISFWEENLISLIQANADIFDVMPEGHSAFEEIDLNQIENPGTIFLLFAEQLEKEELILEQFKNIENFKVQKDIIYNKHFDFNVDHNYYFEICKTAINNNIKFKPMLSKRLASKFIQQGDLNNYHKSLLSCLSTEEKIEVIDYILDKNYRRINLNLNKLTDLKNLLLGKDYNFDAINKLNGVVTQQENTKELITTYNNKIKNLQELIRKRAYVSAILSGPRNKTTIVSELASNISSYLNLRDLRKIK